MFRTTSRRVGFEVVSYECLRADQVGLLPVLQQLLESSVHKGNTRRAVLSREAISITGAFRFDLSELSPSYPLAPTKR